jgi:serine/threonine-protein kinase HipA
MGALEYYPANYKPKTEDKDIELESLINLVEKVLDDRRSFAVNLDEDEEQALAELITIGTSAGGQRPKAIIAYNRKTGEIRSGQVEVPEDFEHFILKFDGIKKGKLSDPAGYGKIEMVYHLMAKECDIDMTYCDLLHKNDRSHFITKRFDRKNGVKIHSQSLCAIAHYDYMQAGMYSYEGALAEMREIGLPYSDFEQLFRRMVFNVVARNQDDHTKNISFLLEKGGEWRIGPAYDVCWSFNPGGDWTNEHQMTINGKRDNFDIRDILSFAEIQNIKRPKEIIEQVIDSVSKWTWLAKEYEIDSDRIEYIRKTHRLFMRDLG